MFFFSNTDLSLYSKFSWNMYLLLRRHSFFITYSSKGKVDIFDFSSVSVWWSG